jgi:hypothetical protein
MRCLLYASVTTDKVTDREFSIAGQLQHLHAHTREKNWEAAGEYSDLPSEAQALTALLGRCEGAEAIEAVLVSELPRRMSDPRIEMLERSLRGSGVQFVPVPQPALSANGSGSH